MATTLPTFDYDNFVEQFPEFGAPLPDDNVQLSWTLGQTCWFNPNQASWGVGSCNNAAQLQMAADLMGAVVCKQFFGTAAEFAANQGTTADNAPGAVESATEGSVTSNFQLPEIGSSGFMSMLLSSPPYGRALLALLQIAQSVGPYIPSCRPGSSRIPP